MYRKLLSLSLVTASALATPARADHIEETIVTGSHDRRVVDVADALVISPDPARLLVKAPGANINGNGPLTGIPQYRGMYGDRIATAINNTALASAGPNAMDPPLSYASTTQLESLQLYRGIAPVSVAQESIGGALRAKTRRPDFGASSEYHLHGQVVGSAQSVNSGYQFGAQLAASNRNHRFSAGAAIEAADDAEFRGGEILPTEYRRERIDLGYGWKYFDHTLQLDYTRSETDDTGTPALPMDIDDIEGDLFSAEYTVDVDTEYQLRLTVFGSDLDHGMTNYQLRQPPAADLWRRNTATAENFGFKLHNTMLDGDSSWLFGLDGLASRHDSDIDNPNNPRFFVVNFNKAEREVLGAFIERQQAFEGPWRGEFGLRANRVKTNAGVVDATPAMMMPPAMALRDAFNAADRRQRDYTTDVVAKVWYDASDRSSWYGGFGFKNRAPSYQERYLWLPLQSTGGLADGFSYTGNIDLDPEESTQLEAGLDYRAGGLTLSPRLFYNHVHRYIQGTPSSNAAAITVVRMMNAVNGTDNPDPLEFNNVKAKLYGFDMDWVWAFGQHWQLSGLISYVRGERRDIGDNLYRIAPPNTSIRLDYNAARWSAGIESVLYARQDKVSETNAEEETPGYGVVNISASWEVIDGLVLAGGVDNLFDREYQQHLGGYNRAANPDLARGDRLPGLGTNLFARFIYSF